MLSSWQSLPANDEGSNNSVIHRFFASLRMTKLKVLLSASSLAAGRTKHG